MLSRYKTIFCLKPRRLVRRIITEPEVFPIFENIGWVWLQKAHLVNNYTQGWICVLDSVPPILLCPTCKQELPTDRQV